MVLERASADAIKLSLFSLIAAAEMGVKMCVCALFLFLFVSILNN